MFYYNLDLYIQETDFIGKTLRDLLDKCESENQKEYLFKNTVILAVNKHDKKYLIRRVKKTLNYIPIS